MFIIKVLGWVSWWKDNGVEVKGGGWERGGGVKTRIVEIGLQSSLDALSVVLGKNVMFLCSV